MRFLKRYNQLINEDTRKEESLVDEAYKDIQGQSFINIDYEKFEAISNVIDEENFSEKIIKIIDYKLDNIKIVHETKYYKQYNPSDLDIHYNKIAGEFRDKLAIERYADDYYTIKNAWGEIGQVGGYVDYYLCDGISGIFKLLHNILLFYSENEDFVKKSLEKTSVNTYLQDILINNEIGEDYYKYNLLFYKNPIYGQLLVNKLIKEEGDIIKILKEYKLFNASNLIFLLDKGYIKKETILEFYPNQFKIFEDELYLIFKGDLSDFDFMYEEDDRKYLEDITDDDMYDNMYDTYSNIGDIYTSYLTDKAINAIKAKIEEVKKTMDKEELEEFDEFDDWEDQLENIDALSDIKWNIINSYNGAQRDADYNQMYDAVLFPLKNFLGTPEKIIRDEKDNILFKFKQEWILLYDYISDSREESYLGKNNSSVGLLGKYVLNNLFDDYNDTSTELLKVDVPYNGWDGNIDKSNLEERILDNL
jgi:hypothetical protein